MLKSDADPAFLPWSRGRTPIFIILPDSCQVHFRLVTTAAGGVVMALFLSCHRLHDRRKVRANRSVYTISEVVLSKCEKKLNHDAGEQFKFC